MPLPRHRLKDETELLANLTGRLSRKSIEAKAQLLDYRLDLPTAWVTFIGETSTGKSTIVNGFLGERLIPATVTPTTATVIQLIFTSQDGDSEPEEDLYEKLCEDDDGSLYLEAGFGREGFEVQCVKPDPNLRRLTLRTARKGPEWAGLQIFDTPGFNSLASSHTEILLDFVPNSDVLVMVVGYRTGFNLPELELFNLVYESYQNALSPPPVMLVVNRAPESALFGDRRVTEIISHARDAFRSDFECVVIPSVRARETDGFVPLDTAALFGKIRELSLSPTAAAKFDRSIESEIASICSESEAWLEKEAKILRSDAAGRKLIKENIGRLEGLKSQAISMINSFFDTLERDCAERLDSGVAGLKSDIREEIEGSGKWTGASECTVYVTSHVIPMGVSRMMDSLSAFIRSELERLNSNLEDLINATMKNFAPSGDLEAPDISSVFLEIGADIAMSVGKNIALGAVKGLGGVGGSAAGLGNLAKKIVSKVGKLFGQTFSRSTYTTIGKIFTKSFVTKLNIALQVIFDSAVMIYEANTWQDKLSETVNGNLSRSLDPDSADSLAGTVMDHLKALRESNIANVPLLLDEQISSLNGIMSGATDAHVRISQIETLAAEFASLRGKAIKEVTA
ncbi:MAG: dynamin family protein [Deltaproteobacteria bacterium]|jgi:hypothetical protein|nr:dynamin family protein [Deltaproteobacteria bacterium]